MAGDAAARGDAPIGALPKRARLIAAIVLGGLIAALVTLNSAGFILRGTGARAGAAMGVFDARSRADYANLLVALKLAQAEGKKPAEFTEPARLARKALARDLLVPEAWRILALDYQARGGPDRLTENLLSASTRVSRRDAATSALLFERLAKANRLREAFRHLDLVLRRSEEGRRALLPAMVQGLAEPVFRREVATALNRGADWSEAFYRQVGVTPALDQQPLVEFVQTLSPKVIRKDRDALEQLAAQLVQKGHYSAAKVVGERLAIPGYGFGAVGFEGVQLNPPFGWALQSTMRYDAVIGSFGGEIAEENALYLGISNAGSFEVARKFVYVPAGPATISAMAGSDGRTPPSAIELAVACGAPGGAVGQVVGRLALRPAEQAVRQTSEFIIPATGCEGQWVMVMVSSDSGTSARGAWVDNIEVRPRGSAPKEEGDGA